jgi:hypothetical protein
VCLAGDPAFAKSIMLPHFGHEKSLAFTQFGWSRCFSDFDIDLVHAGGTYYSPGTMQAQHVLDGPDSSKFRHGCAEVACVLAMAFVEGAAQVFLHKS